MNLHAPQGEHPRCDRESERPLTAPPASPVAEMPPPLERHGYAPSGSNRIFGLVGTGLIFLAAVAGCFLTINHVTSVKAPSALVVFDVHPPASPPETPPRPVEKKEKQPEPQQVRPVELPKIPISPVTVPIPVAVPKPADPGPREPEMAAPKTLSAPSAPQMSSNAPDTWEGRLLAQLAKNRRYPRSAQADKQQGIPYVRIVMDREGKVLSVRLERSSGFPELDREAVALPKRSSPLPKPPDDKPGNTLELVVPVEFFLSAR